MHDPIGTVGPSALAMIVGYGVLIASLVVLGRFAADRAARRRLAAGAITHADAMTIAPTGLVTLVFVLSFFGLI